MGPDTALVVRNRVFEKSFRIATADPGGVRASNLRKAAVTLTLSLNTISTLAEAEPRYPITECRSSLMVSAVADWAGVT